MKIGSVIKKCRKLRNMTQLQVSALADVSESYLSLIEKDKRQPTLSNLESITDTQIESLTKTIYSMIEA